MARHLFNDPTPVRREKLTVALFGKTKFRLGLAFGLATTLLLYFFFAYGREILRSTTAYSGDLLLPTKAEIIAYNLFFAAVSLTAGFGLTTWFWFHNPFSFKHSYSFNQFTRTTILTGTLILLLAVIRTGNWAVFLYGMDGYDNQLSFLYEIPELLILFPAYFFLNIWTPIRVKYRAGNWFWYSILLFCAGTAVLGFSTPIDQTHVNETWEKLNAPYNQIVDAEVARASTHGIQITPETIAILRFRGKQRVLDKAKSLKFAFKSDQPIPTALIVAELILVKKTSFTVVDLSDREDKQRMWPFALPADVYKQITLTNDSVRIGYLTEILAEYRDIFAEQEQNPRARGKKDGLTDKYQNRSFIKEWYRDIGLENERIRDSLARRD